MVPSGPEQVRLRALHPGTEEVADDGCTSTNADVLTVSCVW
jgi:hypothetical protein